MTNLEINAAHIVGNGALADIAWSDTHSKTIENWLENYYGSGNLFKSSFALIICIFITVKIII